MNKRGDIPVTILVIGIFGVCTLAIISFLASGVKFSNSFDGVSVMEKINIQIEETSFYNQPLNGIYSEMNESYFSPEFGFNWIKERTVFSVTYEGEA
jgi:hypothetical protein